MYDDMDDVDDDTSPSGVSRPAKKSENTFEGGGVDVVKDTFDTARTVSIQDG